MKTNITLTLEQFTELSGSSVSSDIVNMIFWIGFFWLSAYFIKLMSEA